MLFLRHLLKSGQPFFILLLKPDLKAEAVDGVTLWRLTGTGTIPHRTIRGGAGVVKTGAQGGWTTVTRLGTH